MRQLYDNEYRMQDAHRYELPIHHNIANEKRIPRVVGDCFVQRLYFEEYEHNYNIDRYEWERRNLVRNRTRGFTIVYALDLRNGQSMGIKEVSLHGLLTNFGVATKLNEAQKPIFIIESPYSSKSALVSLFH